MLVLKYDVAFCNLWIKTSRLLFLIVQKDQSEATKWIFLLHHVRNIKFKIWRHSYPLWRSWRYYYVTQYRIWHIISLLCGKGKENVPRPSCGYMYFTSAAHNFYLKPWISTITIVSLLMYCYVAHKEKRNINVRANTQSMQLKITKKCCHLWWGSTFFAIFLLWYVAVLTRSMNITGLSILSKESWYCYGLLQQWATPSYMAGWTRTLKWHSAQCCI